ISDRFHGEIFVEKILQQAAAPASGLDPDARIGGLKAAILDLQVFDSAAGSRADGHTVAAQEYAVGDGEVLIARSARARGLNRYIVVAAIDCAVADEEIPPGGVDAVSVGSIFGGSNGDAFNRNVGAILRDKMEHRRIAQRHTVDPYTLAILQLDHVRAM